MNNWVHLELQSLRNGDEKGSMRSTPSSDDKKEGVAHHQIQLVIDGQGPGASC
jgi:hypothetical protein